MSRVFGIAMLSCLAIASTGCGASGPAEATASVEVGSAQPQRYRVPSGSMEPTYVIGAHVIAQRGLLAIGAVVIVHPPEGAEAERCGSTPHVVRLGGAACAQPVDKEQPTTSFIKRVVAGPGDQIYVKQGHVYREPVGESKFVRERDHYIKACGSSQEREFPTPITIPSGHWFLMGTTEGNPMTAVSGDRSRRRGSRAW